MPWPIFLDGKILFRHGRPAFSVKCCCGVCRYSVQYQVTLSESSTYPGIPADPPIPEFGTLIYHGRVRDTISDPIGSRYWTHLWVIELCIPEGDDQFVIDYTNELNDWKDAAVPTGAILGSGEDARAIDDIKADFLNTPDAPNQQVDDLLGPNPRPGCPPC